MNNNYSAVNEQTITLPTAARRAPAPTKKRQNHIPEHQLNEVRWEKR